MPSQRQAYLRTTRPAGRRAAPRPIGIETLAASRPRRPRLRARPIPKRPTSAAANRPRAQDADGRLRLAMNRIRPTAKNGTERSVRDSSRKITNHRILGVTNSRLGQVGNRGLPRFTSGAIRGSAIGRALENGGLAKVVNSAILGIANRTKRDGRRKRVGRPRPAQRRATLRRRAPARKRSHRTFPRLPAPRRHRRSSQRLRRFPHRARGCRRPWSFVPPRNRREQVGAPVDAQGVSPSFEIGLRRRPPQSWLELRRAPRGLRRPRSRIRAWRCAARGRKRTSRRS